MRTTSYNKIGELQHTARTYWCSAGCGKHLHYVRPKGGYVCDKCGKLFQKQGKDLFVPMTSAMTHQASVTRRSSARIWLSQEYRNLCHLASFTDEVHPAFFTDFTIRLRPARRRAYKTAYRAWKKRCNTHADPFAIWFGKR